MPPLHLSGLSEPIGADLFGANILAHRDSLEEEARLSTLVEELGVTAMRYPGGSLTEVYFDIANPDAATVYHRDTGESRDFIAISDFFGFAEAHDLPVTLVIPTRDQLSEDRDANGDRYAEVDEEALRSFVHDTVSGTYGEAEIQAFEIGNEYWGSGLMSAAEYGRVASEIARIVDDELAGLSGAHPQAAWVEIVVQMGTNFGVSSLDEDYQTAASATEILDDLNTRYDLELDGEVIRGNGDVNWIEVNNHIVMSYFDEPPETEAVDAIAGHVYSKEPAVDGQRSLMLDAISETWGEDPRFAELETYVTEWNQSGHTGHFDRDEDYGLFQAQEMLNMTEEFARAGVDQAHVWPMLQNSDNALSTGHSHDALSPAGRFFAMMSQELPGKTMLDFNAADPRETEAELPNVDLHGFYGDGEVTFYIASTAQVPSETLIDTAQLFHGAETVGARRLGVEQGDAPGSNSATAVLEELDPEEVFIDGYINAELDRGEILEVTISDFKPTAAFSDALSVLETRDDTVPDLVPDPIVDTDGISERPAAERETSTEEAASARDLESKTEGSAPGLDFRPDLFDHEDNGTTDAPTSLAGVPMLDAGRDADADESGDKEEEIEIPEPGFSGLLWSLLPLLLSFLGL
ncbi:hypothetical protein [Salipiger abyssi]|uniref:Type I secretion target repeat protein n=1 Tax=Salipiger abyssi TaxID=1250539 RepID=A0A1P8UTG0_9RHOB|nr:hypothetical protein [Salipiger abyssi]APZ52693.1 Type I secretion target repeat protein [Salipiger abyssi]